MKITVPHSLDLNHCLSFAFSTLFSFLILFPQLPAAARTSKAIHRIMHAEDLELGVDRVEVYKPWLAGKRVGLVVNQASLNAKGEHTIEFLLGHGVNVIKLFALEHGVRGGGGAGEHIPDGRDEVTGLPIVSLYGNNKKPKPEQLADIDLVVYDIQDVGVRFYTYISSLGLIMEAAAENKKEVVVLDRPNPNGDYIGGPVLKQENTSFVGAFPIPVVYGMTVGELARMIHGQKWKKTEGLVFKIASMKGYNHSMMYEPPKWPSSGLQNYKAVRLYPSIALLEPTVMSFGGGTPHSYLQWGHPQTQGYEYFFTPVPLRPKHNPRHKGLKCYGETYHHLEVQDIPQFTTDLFVRAMKATPVKGFVKERRFLELLVGDTAVVHKMLEGKPYKHIEVGLRSDLNKFKQLRLKYLLY